MMNKLSFQRMALCLLITGSLLYPFNMVAQNPIEAGGTWVVATVAGGVKTVVKKFKNATGESVSDITIVIESDTIAIESVDITSGPGDVEEFDVVDDNDNSMLDATETNEVDGSPTRKCTALLTHGRVIPPDSTIEVGIVFQKDLPPGQVLSVHFSKKIKYTHYNIAATNGNLGTGFASWVIDKPTQSCAISVGNSSADVIKRVLISAPVSMASIDLAPPFEGSQVNIIDPNLAEITFSPGIKPFDQVDLGILFLGLSFGSLQPFTITVIEKEPFECQLALSNPIVSSCNSFGTYDLGFEVQYEPPTGIWQEYTFLNHSGQAVSDLEVTFGGSGGSIYVVAVDHPEECPGPPSIDSCSGRGRTTNHVAYSSTCIEEGSSVKLRVYSSSGPMVPAGGSWAVNGQKVGELDLQNDVIPERTGGMPVEPMKVFVDGQYSSMVVPGCFGAKNVVLTGLPSNGTQNLPISVEWENVTPCQVTLPNAYDAPLCPLKGYFAINSVEQLSYTAPVYAPDTEDGRLNFTYYNPPSGSFQYLNILYKPQQGGAPAWIGQNILLAPSADTAKLALQFDLDPNNDHLFPTFEAVQLSVLITDTLQKSPPLNTDFTLYQVFPGLEHKGNNGGTLDELLDMETGSVLPLSPIVWGVGGTTAILEHRSDMPNIDLVIDRFIPGISHVPADYAGDYNACVPAAVANSTSWLRKKYQAIDDSLDNHLPFNNNSGDSAALRNLVYEYSRLMGRKLGYGVRYDSAILGKMDFIDRFKVPIRVKFQTMYSDTNIASPDRRYGHVAECINNKNNAGSLRKRVSLDSIVNEYKKGEDVELTLYWFQYDSFTNKLKSGLCHWVVITFIDTVDGKLQLYLKDDRNQLCKGGVDQERISNVQVDTNPASKFRNLLQLPELKSEIFGQCVIGGMLSESYDPSLTFNILKIGSTQVTPAKCHDSPTGKIVVTPTGGVSPYIILWSNGLSGETIDNLVTGPYTFTITDAWGNTAIGNVYVPSPPPPVVEASIVKPNCASDPTGSISISVLGGNPPYFIEWTNGQTGPILTGLTAGIYTAIITDQTGCVTFRNVVVTALDNTPPTVTTSMNPIVVLNGCCSPLTPGMFQAIGNDNCGPVTLSVIPPVVDCSNLGVTPVTIKATDSNGNTAAAIATVTVIDATPPVAIPANITAVLDANGQVVVDPALVGAPSIDNCSIASYTLSQTSFDCSLVGPNPVMLTITDPAGNMATTMATIQVQDITPPVVQTQNIVVLLNETGVATIETSDVLLNVSDACGILSVELSQDKFYCDNPNENEIIIEVVATDVHGNVTRAPVLVTVIDPVHPTIVCPSNVTVPYCSPVNYLLPEAFDNCVVETIELIAGLGSGAVFPVGVTEEVYRASDLSGNQSTCSFSVTVLDHWDLSAEIGMLRCFGTTDGFIHLEIMGGQPPYLFNWSNGQTANPITDLGAGTYSVTATDVYGCSSSWQFSIEQPDTLALTVIKVLDETNGQGNGSIVLTATGGTAPYHYNNQNFVDTLTLTGLSAGNYPLVVTDNFDCSASVSITIENISSTVEAGLIEQFLVYPNPATDQFQVHIRLGKEVEGQLSLSNAEGKVVMHWPIDWAATFDQTIPVSHLASGAYLLELKMASGGLISKKVMILR